MTCATILLKCLILPLLYQEVNAEFVIEWVNCTSDNHEISRYEVCSVSSNKRNQQTFSYYAKIFTTVSACDTRVEIIYLTPPKPLTLANISFDACELLKGRKRFVAAKRLFDIIEKHTNFNHTCPYNHDVFGTNITLAPEKLPFPKPHGKYSVKISFYVNGKANTMMVAGVGRVM
uniref:MD-2-related lipid-recognition domain-containing protein n=1 Tax=Stomoxys calcitrans TaxID=35570 RepID=A0A1I8PGN3_STOCA